MIYLAYFFAGAFPLNAVPHLVAGAQGLRFPTPFASPPTVGLSPPWVNVLWGSANLVIAWLLAFLVGGFVLTASDHALAALAGAIVMGVGLSMHFQKLRHGGKL